MSSDANSHLSSRLTQALIWYLKWVLPWLLFVGVVVFYLFARRGLGIGANRVALIYVAYALVVSTTEIAWVVLREEKRSKHWQLRLNLIAFLANMNGLAVALFALRAPPSPELWLVLGIAGSLAAYLVYRRNV